MTTNQVLGRRAREIADREPRGSAARTAALCAAVVLSTTQTTAGARRALAEWDGPAGIRDAAGKLLDQLEETTP